MENIEGTKQDWSAIREKINNNFIEAKNIIDVTYAELTSKITESKLVAGQFYNITDFATIHYFLSGNTTITSEINTGTIEPLIVLATDADKLDKIAYSKTHPYDLIYYDWDSSNYLYDISFSNGGVIITGWKGVIYYRKDTRYNVETYYDWRNVKLRRWKLNPVVWDIETNFAQYAIVQGSNGKIYYSISADNLGNDPVSNEYTLWRPLIDFDVTNLYLSLTQTTYTIEHYIDGSVRNFNVPCSELYEDYLTFGNVALTDKNIDILIGRRNTNTISIINNLLLNVTTRTIQFAYIKFDSHAYNSTIITNTMYYCEFGRYFYNNLLLGNGTTCFDLQNDQGGFFKNVLINPIKNNWKVDFYQNICASGLYSNSFNQEISKNYFSKDFRHNVVFQNHYNNIWGKSISSCSFGQTCTGNDFRYGNFVGCIFGNYFQLNTLAYNGSSALVYVNFGINFESNTINNKINYTNFGNRVNNNTFNGIVNYCYIGSLTNRVTYGSTELRKANFEDGWKLSTSSLDLSSVVKLYNYYYSKKIYVNGSGTPTYILEYMDASNVFTLADLVTDSILKTL